MGGVRQPTPMLLKRKKAGSNPVTQYTIYERLFGSSQYYDFWDETGGLCGYTQGCIKIPKGTEIKDWRYPFSNFYIALTGGQSFGYDDHQTQTGPPAIRNLFAFANFGPSFSFTDAFPDPTYNLPQLNEMLKDVGLVAKKSRLPVGYWKHYNDGTIRTVTYVRTIAGDQFISGISFEGANTANANFNVNMLLHFDGNNWTQVNRKVTVLPDK